MCAYLSTVTFPYYIVYFLEPQMTSVLIKRGLVLEGLKPKSRHCGYTQLEMTESKKGNPL